MTTSSQGMMESTTFSTGNIGSGIGVVKHSSLESTTTIAPPQPPSTPTKRVSEVQVQSNTPSKRRQLETSEDEEDHAAFPPDVASPTMTPRKRGRKPNPNLPTTMHASQKEVHVRMKHDAARPNAGRRASAGRNLLGDLDKPPDLSLNSADPGKQDEPPPLAGKVRSTRTSDGCPAQEGQGNGSPRRTKKSGAAAVTLDVFFKASKPSAPGHERSVGLQAKGQPKRLLQDSNAVTMLFVSRMSERGGMWNASKEAVA